MKGSGLKESKPVQEKTSHAEEEVLQGKFAAFPGKEIPEEEISQRKPEVIQNEQSVMDRHKLLQINEENGRGAGDRQLPLQLKKEDKNMPDRHRLLQINKENNTGLPDDMKAGLENLSGLSMDNVRVHYNSDKPAKVGAQAYTQGTNIHVAPEQEKHLPHEAWHLVQQAQGRVPPTMQLKGVALNDDERLEKEADLMGQASRSLNRPDSVHPRETGELNTNNNLIIQRTIDKDELKGKDRKNYNEISKKYYARFGLSAPDYQQIDSYNVKSFEQCCEEANSLVELAKLVDAQIVKADEARAKASAKSAGSTATMPVTTLQHLQHEAHSSSVSTAAMPGTTATMPGTTAGLSETASAAAATGTPKKESVPQAAAAPKEEPSSPKEAHTHKKGRKKAPPMSLAEFNASLPETPAPSAWAKKLEFKPEVLTPGPPQAPQATTPHKAPPKDKAGDVISHLKAWRPGTEGHSGEKNTGLSLEDLEKIWTWVKEDGRYNIVLGPGTGEYALKYQFKIIHKQVTVPQDQKNATYHITIDPSVYEQWVEKYESGQNE